MTLFVSFIAAPTPQVAEAVKPSPPKPRVTEKPQARRLVAAAPIVAPADPLAAAPPVAVIEAPSVPAPRKVGPVTLGSELAVSCPDRTPPDYASISRRSAEQGSVTLRVELDEQGRVTAARVASGSGYPRLDEAALAAVRNWRCTPAQRDGQPVRAIALQAFEFILQGN